ncbi:MAG: APC family permease [Desulfurococcus sp.]|uniref:APC family permease n=1 Tax=Desulfurococcus sp. TaxID=51678 RepID=UPI003D0DA03A
MAARELYVRKASGLVRAMSAFDAMNLNISMCSPPQGVLWAWTFGPAMILGVNLTLSYFLGIWVILVSGAILYALWMIAIPRSGGDYVWFSRAVHPAFGFAVNWFFSFVFLNWYAMNLQTMGPFWLSPILYTLGYKELADWASSWVGSVIIGTIFNIAFTILLLYGISLYSKLWKYLFFIVLAGSIVYAAILYLTPTSVFISRFNAISSVKYNEIIDLAMKHGWVAGWTMGAVLMGLVFPLQNYNWAGFPAYVAGEVRRVEKSAWIGIVGGLVVMGLWYTLLGNSIYHVAGLDFHNALAYIYNRLPDKYPLPLPPYPQTYLWILYPDLVWLQVLVGFLWFLSNVYLTPPNLLITSRNMFAWSFDRLLPTRLTKVNEKGAPVYTIIVSAIIGELIMMFVATATYQVMIMNTFIVMMVVLGLVGLASFVFPFVKKEMYNMFPDQAKISIGGYPLISLAGLTTAVVAFWGAYSMASVPALGGLSTASLIFNIAILLASIPVYVGAYLYNKRVLGLDLTLLFKEIPPG